MVRIIAIPPTLMEREQSSRSENCEDSVEHSNDRKSIDPPVCYTSLDVAVEVIHKAAVALPACPDRDTALRDLGNGSYWHAEISRISTCTLEDAFDYVDAAYALNGLTDGSRQALAWLRCQMKKSL
ncbi:MAG: hypothetical protein KGL39_23985 [Patescibacteria group bacterium]|nr:hypothetical protein [Patescibacteria group bacterium]